MKTLREVQARLRSLANPDIAAHSQRFFKTGPGQYGEGDRFLGIRVPELRKVARAARAAPPEVAWRLVASSWHEERLTGLLMLVHAFEKGDPALREAIFARYLEVIDSGVNNWDLVDTSAHVIVGQHLHGAPNCATMLTRLGKSASLWERRVAVIATYAFIKRGDFEETLRLAGLLLEDPEDLIHKAVGWMLREVGKRDEAVLDGFLAQRYERMPRTMLRYAIERLPESRRRAYLEGEA